MNNEKLVLYNESEGKLDEKASKIIGCPKCPHYVEGKCLAHVCEGHTMRA